LGAGRTYQLNINSIHAYDGVKGKKNQANNQRSQNVAVPYAVRANVNFGDKINNAEGILSRIKNTDYMGMLGKWKQSIETAGFLVIFLIQDMIGMTLPRTWTGFNRDREITGKLHYQEGFEVLGREGLTGPAMMAVPSAVFAITAATMGKSTFTNSRLIKTYGKTFMNTVKEIAGTKGRPEIQAQFIENGLKQIIKDSIGAEAKPEIINKVKNKLINLSKFEEIKAGLSGKNNKVADFEKEFGYTLDEIKKLIKDETINSATDLTQKQTDKLLKSLKKDLKNSSATDLQNYIDNALLEKSGEDLSKLSKVKLDGNSYDASEATSALFKYSEDAIVNNKKLAEMDEAKAENFMHNMLGKRAVSNLSAMAAVLGVMNYLPKLYARSETSPGEVSKAMAKENENVTNNNKGEVAFTGLFSGIGKKTAKWGNFALAEGEFHGINFSSTVMTALSIVGLTIPRGKRAYDRAPEKTPEQRQNEGWFSRLFDKDVSEIKEIAVRDPISALSVVFAVPLLTRAMVNAYEKSSGFVLINHLENEGKGLKKFLNYLNPYNSISVLSNKELDALYGKVDTHSKLVNVSEYIAKKGGDLEKIFAKSIDKAEIFNENTFTLNSLRETAKGMENKKAALEFKNNKIIELIKKADATMQNKMVNSLLPTLKNNKALGAAKTLNALPFFLNLMVISPFILGVVIPKYTYALTRNAADKVKNPNPQSPVQQPQEIEQKKNLELKTV